MLLYSCPGDRPTLPELIRFRGRGGCINIPQQISTNFLNFGILLLEDENGTRIRSIIHKYRENSEQINIKVLEEWIAGRGKHPVSWDTLIEVLQVIGLGALASDIAAVKCSWVLTDVIFLCVCVHVCVCVYECPTQYIAPKHNRLSHPTWYCYRASVLRKAYMKQHAPFGLL